LPFPLEAPAFSPPPLLHVGMPRDATPATACTPPPPKVGLYTSVAFFSGASTVFRPVLHRWFVQFIGKPSTFEQKTSPAAPCEFLFYFPFPAIYPTLFFFLTLTYIRCARPPFGLLDHVATCKLTTHAPPISKAPPPFIATPGFLCLFLLAGGRNGELILYFPLL